MTRYVFDTNVIVSALLFNASKPGLAFLEALDRGTILASAKLLTELNDVLSRPKFGRYIDPEERERFLGAFVREVRFVEIAKQFALVGIPRTIRSWNWLVTGVMLLLIVLPFAFIITHRWAGI